MYDNKSLISGHIGQARSSLFQAIEVHEKAEHGGQVCWTERENSIAFLCHALGLTQGNVSKIGELLADYDTRHQEHNHSTPDAQKAFGH